MTPLPCPTCGFDVRPDLERMKRLAIAKSAQSETHWHVVGIECASCDTYFHVDRGLSLDGVGPERLVPVEVEA